MLFLLFAVLALGGCNRGGATDGGRAGPTDGAVGRAAAADSPPTFGVLADTTLTVGAGSQILGTNVGVNSTSDGAVEIQLGTGVTVDPTQGVYGHNVSLGADATVGALYADNVINAGGAYRTLSPFAAVPLAPGAGGAWPGQAAVTVPAGTELDLSPGRYGVVTVQPNAILRLLGGTYDARSVTIDSGAEIVVEQPSLLRVATLFTMNGGTVEADPLIGDAVNLTILDLGSDARGSTPMPAVSIAPGGVVSAIVLAPHGTISVGDGATVTGGLLGQAVDIGAGVMVVSDNSWDPWIPCQFSFCYYIVGQNGTAERLIRCSSVAAGDGTVCSDGDECTTGDSCQGGACTGTPKVCTAEDACHTAGTCNPANGTCSNPAAPDGTSCGSGVVCSSGTCEADCYIGGTLYAAGASNPANACQACAPSASTTAWTNVSDGTSCGSGVVCSSGTCVAECYIGGTLYAAGAADPANACQACTPEASTTAWTNVSDGTACNDGNACTANDVCTNGTCAGTPYSCTPNQCQQAGACDGNGGCSFASKPDGTACDDGDACTQIDICQNGACTGSNPVVCTALDQCHVAGVCNPSTGQCSNPAAADGTACNDGNACTQSDVCQGGVCNGSNIALTYDEFIPLYGSSSTWVSLQDFGGAITYDGSTNDITQALQNAFDPGSTDSLPNTWSKGGPTVLYIPPGTYQVHDKIQILDSYGITVVGDDPSTTTLQWTGPSDQVMFQIVDTTNAKLSRLTLDGGHTASNPGAEALVELVNSNCQYYNLPNSQCNINSTLTGYGVFFIEFNDDVFQHAQMGIVGDSYLLANQITLAGNSGLPNTITSASVSVANSVVRRSRFVDLTEFGLVLANSNALDWLIADSVFTYCGTSGDPGNPAGAIVALDGSVVAVNDQFENNNRDFYFDGGFSNVVRGNTSTGSNAFLLVSGSGFNANVDVSGNYIQTSGQPVVGPNAEDDECNTPYVLCVNVANLTFLDNYVDPGGGVGIYTLGNGPVMGVPGLSTAIVEGNNGFKGPSSSLITPWGSYSPPSPVTQVAADSTGQSPTVPAPAAFALANTPFTTTWGVTPAKSTRSIYDASAPSNGCTTQGNTSCAAALNAWLGGNPQGWALYFPSGMYYIDAPIDVPAGLDVTILGDGSTSRIFWDGPPSQGADPYMFHFHGDTANAVGSIRDLYLALLDSQTISRPGGVEIDVADIAGDMVFLDQATAGYAKSPVDVAGLDNVVVRADQSGAGPLEHMFCATGAGAGASGSSLTQGLVMFGGGGSSLASYGELGGWGKAVLLGTDNEGSTQGFTLGGSGYLTMDGARLITGPSLNPYYPSVPDNVIQSTFLGNATFMNLDDSADLISTADPAANVLSAGNIRNYGYNAPPGPCPEAACGFTQLNNTSNQMEIGDGDICPGYSRCADQDSGNAGSFVATMVSDLRSTYAAPPPRSCGVANVRIHRLYFQGITTGAPADLGLAGVRVQHF